MSDVPVTASQSVDNGLPSRLFSARKVGELALQVVGAFTTMDASPEPTDLERAIEWMELGIAQLSGVERLQILVPATVEFALEADTPSYVLSDVAGTAFPSKRIARPIEAYVRVDDGPESRIDIERRRDFEGISSKDTSGTPGLVYIDRTGEDPTIYVYPVPTGSTTTTYLRLVCETYAQSVLGPNADPDQAGNAAHGFESPWQLWIVHMTAALIGNGPVRMLSKQRLDDIRALADRGLAGLMTKHNRENRSLHLQRTRRYGG